MREPDEFLVKTLRYYLRQPNPPLAVTWHGAGGCTLGTEAALLVRLKHGHSVVFGYDVAGHRAVVTADRILTEGEDLATNEHQPSHDENSEEGRP